MPIISIIVPVYNVEKYIHRCVDSIITQSFTDWECILVDDGSPDNCPAICDEYATKDSRIKVIHKENGGVSAARNDAIKIAQGKYITFCDSDDYVAEDWLQKMNEAMIDNNADCVGIQFIHLYETGEIISKSNCSEEHFELNSVSDKIDFIIEGLFQKRYGWELCRYMYKSSLIKQCGINICESCSNFAEDLNFTLKYLLHCKKIILLSDNCYFYVQHEGSMMSNSKSLVKFDALNEVSKDFGKHFFAQRFSREINSYFPVLHFLIIYNQVVKLLSHPIDLDRFILELSKISDKKWFKKHIKKLLWRYKMLKNYYGKIPAQRIVVFSRFLYHQNKFIYKYERAIYYKFFYN